MNNLKKTISIGKEGFELLLSNNGSLNCLKILEDKYKLSLKIIRNYIELYFKRFLSPCPTKLQKKIYEELIQNKLAKKTKQDGLEKTNDIARIIDEYLKSEDIEIDQIVSKHTYVNINTFNLYLNQFAQKPQHNDLISKFVKERIVRRNNVISLVFGLGIDPNSKSEKPLEYYDLKNIQDYKKIMLSVNRLKVEGIIPNAFYTRMATLEIIFN